MSGGQKALAELFRMGTQQRHALEKQAHDAHQKARQSKREFEEKVSKVKKGGILKLAQQEAHTFEHDNSELLNEYLKVLPPQEHKTFEHIFSNLMQMEEQDGENMLLLVHHAMALTGPCLLYTSPSPRDRG